MCFFNLLDKFVLSVAVLKNNREDLLILAYKNKPIVGLNGLSEITEVNKEVPGPDCLLPPADDAVKCILNTVSEHVLLLFSLISSVFFHLLMPVSFLPMSRDLHRVLDGETRHAMALKDLSVLSLRHDEFGPRVVISLPLLTRVKACELHLLEVLPCIFSLDLAVRQSAHLGRLLLGHDLVFSVDSLP